MKLVILYCGLFIYCFIHLITSVSLDDESLISVYRDMYEEHNNLVFMSYGDNSYHQLVIKTLIRHIFTQKPLIQCVNINEHDHMEKTFRDFHKLNKGKERLFIVHNLEQLTNLIRNNYLFRVKDPTAYSKMIVLLTWDSSSQPLIDQESLSADLSSSHQILQALESKINSDDQYVNGAAATARIDDVFYESKYAAVSSELIENHIFCNLVMNDSCSTSSSSSSPMDLSTSSTGIFSRIKKLLFDSFYPKIIITGISFFTVYYWLSSSWSSNSTTPNKTNSESRNQPPSHNPSRAPSRMPSEHLPASRLTSNDRANSFPSTQNDESSSASDHDREDQEAENDYPSHITDGSKFLSPPAHKPTGRSTGSKKKHKMVTRSKEKPPSDAATGCASKDGL
jgi:hypothetical protein